MPQLKTSICTLDPESQVVRLPSAARRKVRQMEKGEERRALAAALPQFTGKYVSPSQRTELWRADQRRALLADLRRTPELALALALYGVLSPKDRSKAKSTLQHLGATLPDDSARVVLALLGEGK